MSLLIKGELRDDWFDKTTDSGEYIRQDSQFRHWITADGRSAPDGAKAYPAEAGRYHLYVSYACPWANRTLIFRTLKKLETLISVSVVHPDMGVEGWKFADFRGATRDHVHDYEFMHQVYTLAQADYTGIVTVPVLFDKKTNTIVNNESSEIIRMFNSAFNHLTGDGTDFYPKHLRKEINDINAFVYDNVNNGVYRCGFARTQAIYEAGFDQLFAGLERLEQRLSQQRYLAGNTLTEADWRLFVTLVRFDAVYYSHFKCNLQRIIDYPNLANYVRELYQYPGIRATIDFDHIKRHYYWSHDAINPTRIVPKGPALDFDAPHDRERFS